MNLKKYFNLDIPLSPKNGVDIYSVADGGELFRKLAQPIPFCQYCDITDKCIEENWGLSRRDRYEWLTFEFTEADVEYLKTKTPTVYVFGAGVWGKRTITLLQSYKIPIRAVVVTRKAESSHEILGVPIVLVDDIAEPEQDSICLVALGSSDTKAEVYPILSKVGFGSVIPVTGMTE